MKTETRIRPSTTTNEYVPSIGSQLVSSAGPTLNSISANPIAITNEKMIWPRRDLGRDLLPVASSPSSRSSCIA